MIRYLSTGSSVIAALMSDDRQELPILPARPDLLEFLLVRNLGNTVSHAGEASPPPADRSSR